MQSEFDNTGPENIELNLLAKILIAIRHNRGAAEMFLKSTIDDSELYCAPNATDADVLMESNKFLAEFAFTQLNELILKYDKGNFMQCISSKGFFPARCSADHISENNLHLVQAIKRKGNNLIAKLFHNMCCVAKFCSVLAFPALKKLCYNVKLKSDF